MRTPVVLIAGQGDADEVASQLSRKPGTVLVRHVFDGQVVLIGPDSPVPNGGRMF